MVRTIFQHSQLRSFFELLKKYNTVVPLRDCREDQCVIMRHDVDFDVQAAMDFADIEEEQGLCSTYIFLTTSPMYNVTSLINRQRLRELQTRGFEIGLHFDPLIYGDVDDVAMLRHAKYESEILETIVGEPVRSISVHNPSVHGKLWQGWLCLAVVMDLYSRKIVGWSMKPTLERALVLDALLMTVWRRKPQQQVLIHSDQGSQYGSDDWLHFCSSNLGPSMSRRGNC